MTHSYTSFRKNESAKILNFAVLNWDIKLFSVSLFRTHKIYLFFSPKMSENGTKGDTGGKMCIHRCFDNEP